MKKYIALFFLLFFFPGIGQTEEKADFFKSVKLNVQYIGEELANLSGGIKKGHAYRGDLNVSLSLDTGNAGLWKSGQLFLNFENGNGEGITEKNAGVFHELSNIEAPNFTQVSQYYIEQSFSGDSFHVTFGKQDSNEDFAVTENAHKFLNSSFALMPNVPLPTFPNPSLGIYIESALCEEISFRAGIFDAKGSGGSWGFSTALGPDAVSIGVAEIEKEYKFFSSGSVKFGGWRQGGMHPSFRDSLRAKSFDYGGYIILEQKIIGTEGKGRNINVFFNYSSAPDDYNFIPQFFDMGLKLSGLISSRPEDSMGIGLANIGISNHVYGLKNQTNLEIYYLAPVHGISFQPDIQYTWNPGGKYPDELAAGIRCRVNF